ncbi:MAG: hypothetical protein OXR82_11055 [Gammaproteobacteria bacterium]|nr:hypothetical protein [Gammaproteobacteria bacterium]MDE0258904.1 hypothetical protein [Gammaproteobacteria bacterium]
MRTVLAIIALATTASILTGHVHAQELTNAQYMSCVREMSNRVYEEGWKERCLRFLGLNQGDPAYDSVVAHHDSLIATLSTEDFDYCRAKTVIRDSAAFWRICQSVLESRARQEEFDRVVEQDRLREELARLQRCEENGTAALGLSLMDAICDVVVRVEREGDRLGVVLNHETGRMVGTKSLDAMEFTQVVCVAWNKLHGGSQALFVTEAGLRLVTVTCSGIPDFEWHIQL